MKIRHGHVAAVGVCAVLTWLTVNLAYPSSRESPKPTPPRETGPAQALAGVGSCAGRGCHGSLAPNRAPDSVEQSEYSTWIVHDRHARAYEALLSERGQRIAKNLEPFGYKPAEQEPRCLACHATPQTALGQDEHSVKLRSDGVGCEACHGPANGAKPWLEAHVMGGWRKKTDEERKAIYHEHGMTDLSDPLVQAKTCVGCHVGAPAGDGLPARDLNHDLMAAGHPRLLFELSAYQQNLPPHWRADKYKMSDPHREARLWAAGQVETARAALDLLADRARGDEKSWPEFAEYDCFACHTNLRPGNVSWRLGRKDLDRRRGALPYSVWHSTALPILDSSTASAFKDLGTAMAQASPDRAKVKQLAEDAKKKVDGLAKQVQGKFDEATLKKMTQALTELKPAPTDLTWDEMEQRALAAAALHQALHMGDDGVQAKLNALFKALAFPPGFDSPRDFRRAPPKTEPVDQPGVKELEELLKALK
jgi:hypothetical protein